MQLAALFALPCALYAGRQPPARYDQRAANPVVYSLNGREPRGTSPAGQCSALLGRATCPPIADFYHAHCALHNGLPNAETIKQTATKVLLPDSTKTSKHGPALDRPTNRRAIVVYPTKKGSVAWLVWS